MDNKRRSIELADIFSSHAQDYLNNHRLCEEQHKALTSVIQCRTASLGGHVDTCNNCGFTKPSYNSCRNRHCPKCQYIKKTQWVDKLAGNLPPTKHFHLVFTIPSCLHKLFYINQRFAYKLLFKAAGSTLNQCARNPAYLGAEPGAVAILHTWGQTLVYHPHIHMIVPAGGLAEDRSEWIPSGKKFFLPVRMLSMVFRGILCRLLEQAVESEDMSLPEDCGSFKTLKTQCYKNNWVIYCEKPFSCSDSLIQYLGNYTHRVAISNQRIIKHENGQVSFYYKDYRTAGLRKTITLTVEEFIRRFMQHILPDGFSKIRYFGFLSICNMKTKLAECFDLIEKTSYIPELQGLSALEVLRTISGKDPLLCQKCHAGKMMARKKISAGGFEAG